MFDSSINHRIILTVFTWSKYDNDVDEDDKKDIDVWYSWWYCEDDDSSTSLWYYDDDDSSRTSLEVHIS